MDQNISILELEDAYQNNRRDAQNIIKSARAFSDNYIDDLYNRHKGLFTNREDAEHLVYGTSYDESRFSLEPVSKMKSDILKKEKGTLNKILK